MIARLYWSCSTPELVSSCEYTRTQNCTSRSSSGGRGIGVSAKAGASASRALKRSARDASGRELNLRRPVGFIYTWYRVRVLSAHQGVAGAHSRERSRGGPDNTS